MNGQTGCTVGIVIRGNVELKLTVHVTNVNLTLHRQNPATFFKLLFFKCNVQQERLKTYVATENFPKSERPRDHYET